MGAPLCLWSGEQCVVRCAAYSAETCPADCVTARRGDVRYCLNPCGAMKGSAACAAASNGLCFHQNGVCFPVCDQIDYQPSLWPCLSGKTHANCAAITDLNQCINHVSPWNQNYRDYPCQVLGGRCEFKCSGFGAWCAAPCIYEMNRCIANCQQLDGNRCSLFNDTCFWSTSTSMCRTRCELVRPKAEMINDKPPEYSPSWCPAGCRVPSAEDAACITDCSSHGATDCERVIGCEWNVAKERCAMTCSTADVCPADTCVRLTVSPWCRPRKASQNLF